jgi:hypothetical protein
MNTRWSIWIDIEGFSKLWPDSDVGLEGLKSLMLGIFEIGSQVFPDPENRLFAHQFGDGFVITSVFKEDCLDRCAAIAVCLMRYITNSGCLARAAIAEGDFADIKGCWPKAIRDACEDDRVYIGQGLMTLIPVMGTALINANKLDASNRVKGALLTIETKNRNRISDSFASTVSSQSSEHHIIDWVHSRSCMIDHISTKVAMENTTDGQLENALKNYIAKHKLSNEWAHNTLYYNNLKPDAD